jgi:hypothetical protein
MLMRRRMRLEVRGFELGLKLFYLLATIGTMRKKPVLIRPKAL